MLELPEVLAMASKLQEAVAGKTVSQVLPPTKVHKFCWYRGELLEYQEALAGKRILGGEGFGLFVEICFEEGYKLCFNDGVNVRRMPVEKVPPNYQLLITLDDGMALVFTVAMYGGIILHRDDYDNEYYEKSREAVSPFSQDFRPYFWNRMEESRQGLSAKAFLAAQQRFPGIGNGVLQDILFVPRIHPKRKLQSLDQEERERLLEVTVSVLQEMTEKGGRDTEKDLYGNPGGYLTRMSKITWKDPCPICGGFITKQNFLGGSVYYCSACQKEEG